MQGTEFVTPKYEHSPVFPIHVIKSTNPPNIDCEVDSCRRFMQIAWSSGNPGKEYMHLERTKNAKCYVQPAALQCTSLKDMLSKGLMSSEWGLKCEQLNNAANNHGVDSVFPLFFGDVGYSNRWYFFSVFTNEKDSWCQFGRTRVTFDAVVGQWNCQCQGTGRSHRCVHRMMGMWWIFSRVPRHPSVHLRYSRSVQSSITCEPQSVNTQKICIMTEYLSKQKRIPCLLELPLKLRTHEEEPPQCFSPSENTCPYRPRPTAPVLNPIKVVTSQAVVYGIKYIRKGVSGAVKECLRCANFVRFQE